MYVSLKFFEWQFSQKQKSFTAPASFPGLKVEFHISDIYKQIQTNSTYHVEWIPVLIWHGVHLMTGVQLVSFFSTQENPEHHTAVQLSLKLWCIPIWENKTPKEYSMPTSVALVLVSSSVWTSSTLSNMLPWVWANSLSRESSRSFSSFLFSLKTHTTYPTTVYTVLLD